MSFDLKRSLRRFKPRRRIARLIRRSDEALPFISEKAASGPELLLDTCVYIDILQHRAPEGVNSLLMARLSNHSGVALAELTHLFGRLDPRDDRTGRVLAEISGVIADMPGHRLTAPSRNVLAVAGILAGFSANSFFSASQLAGTQVRRKIRTGKKEEEIWVNPWEEEPAEEDRIPNCPF